MKVFICLSVFVVAAVALHLPEHRPPRPGRPHPVPEDIEDDIDNSFPRPEPPVRPMPPHIPDHPHPELEELFNDVRDFMRLLPHREIRALVKSSFRNDPTFKATITYMRSPNFHHVMKEMGQLVEVQDLFTPFIESHIEPQDIAVRTFTAIDDEIEIIPLPEPVDDLPTGGICGLVDRVIAILPHEELRELHREKVANGGKFAKIVAFLTSDEFQARLQTALQSERFLELDAILRENGVCLDKFFELKLNVFGFH
ncbi:hypothetical protein DMENIID0001_066610 [Sergentomyia squamirostris]